MDIILLTPFLITALQAQEQSLIQDREKIFTNEETHRIDSFLQIYRKKSGNLVAVYTDSSDISTNAFIETVYATYQSPGTDSSYSFILLMSRNNSLLFGSVNKHTSLFMNDNLLLGLMESGFQLLKEKKTAEGVTIICTKAMEFFDSLSKQ